MTVKKTGEQLGIAAGGDTGLLTPNDILNLGVKNVFDAISNLMTNIPVNLEIFTRILGIVILGFALYAFLKIACTLFFTYVEFIIVGGLSMVLLPWSMTKWTKGIADKAWGILLSGAVKIMVCVFMVSLVSGFIENSFSNLDIDNPSLPDLLTNTISLGFLAFLVGKSVEYAGAMTNGLTVSSPNMISSAAGTAARIPGNVRTAGNFVKGSVATARATKKGASKAGEWWLKHGGGIPL